MVVKESKTLGSNRKLSIRYSPCTRGKDTTICTITVDAPVASATLAAQGVWDALAASKTHLLIDKRPA